MTFEQALTAMRNGQKINRPGWKKFAYLFMKDDKIYDHSADDGKDYYFGQFAQKLVTAEDWQIVEG